MACLTPVGHTRRPGRRQVPCRPSAGMVIAMAEQLAGHLTVASLNTWGLHILGSDLAARYTVIGTEFEAGRADVVCFQEVFSYWHLRLLARRMPRSEENTSEHQSLRHL